ncbi:hypothetical protein LINGRAPRIM_LOCUS3186 [Linum grandiflorum]
MASNFPGDDDQTPPIYVPCPRCGVPTRHGDRCTSPQCQHTRHGRIRIHCKVCGDTYAQGMKCDSENHAKALAKMEAKEKKKREERKKLKDKAGESSQIGAGTTTGKED